MINNHLTLDLLWIFREFLIKGDNEMGNYPDAVARYLLVQLGINISNVDETDQIFWQRANAGTLGDLTDAIGRIANCVQDNDWLKRYIISSMAAIVTAQNSNLTDEQAGFMRVFQDVFDMRPSEFDSALSEGEEWGIALQFIADEYARSKGYID